MEILGKIIIVILIEGLIGIITMYFNVVLYAFIRGVFAFDEFMSEDLKQKYEDNTLQLCKSGALVYVIAMLPFVIEVQFGIDASQYYPDELLYCLLGYMILVHPIVFILYLKYKSK